MRRVAIAFWVALGISVSGLSAPVQVQAQGQGQAAAAPQTEAASSALKPLSRTQVDDLVASGLDSETLAKVVHERGIDFQANQRYLDTLRSQGAMQALIDALKTASPDPLSKAQILKSLAGGTPQDDLVGMVERRGVDFKPTPEDIDTLRIAGAEDPLCQAVEHAKQGQPSASNLDASSGHVYDVGADVTAPVPIYHPDPPLTAEARRARVAPVAKVYVTVDRNGGVKDVRLTKGLGLGLDKKAVDTLRTWTFKPGMRDGQPVAVRMKMDVSFAANAQSVPVPE